jgi:hypothetical protein
MSVACRNMVVALLFNAISDNHDVSSSTALPLSASRTWQLIAEPSMKRPAVAQDSGSIDNSLGRRRPYGTHCPKRMRQAMFLSRRRAPSFFCWR